MQPELIAHHRRLTFPPIAGAALALRKDVVAALIIGFGYNATFDHKLLDDRYAEHMTLYLVERKKPPAGLFQPPGGKIEGQDFDVGHTASRECREEIGFDVIPVRSLGTTKIIGLPGIPDSNLHHVLCISRHNLGLDVSLPQTRLKLDECVRRLWVPLESLFEGAFLEPQVPSVADSVNLIRQKLSSHTWRANVYSELVSIRRAFRG